MSITTRQCVYRHGHLSLGYGHWHIQPSNVLRTPNSTYCYYLIPLLKANAYLGGEVALHKREEAPL
jgi:hypothetical protein